MATNGHLLQQQSTLTEARLKTLVNNDLKIICRAYNQPVSGTKPELQKKCIDILRGIVQRGEVAGYHEFSARVSHHGDLPTAHQISNTSLGMQRPANPPAVRADFKTSPFYERLEVVTKPHDLPEMPQNRHTLRVDLILTEQQARLLNDSPQQHKLMVYCAQTSFASFSAYDVAFPSQVEIKINEEDVKANFKGLKNKPGTTKPAEITRLVRARAGYVNKMTVCYALTHKRYVFTTYLVRHVDAATLVQKIRSNRVFPKSKVLEEITRHNADPDIAPISSKMSLKDPVSTTRISVPIRSTVCSHNQCFDASYFLQLQEQAPTWQCPICNKSVSFESLSVDKYFEEILTSTPQNIEQVTVEPDGQWRVVKDDEEKGMSNAAKGARRAAYDDDFDDDIIELSPDTKPAALSKSAANGITKVSTPNTSSRETSIAQSHTQANKRTSKVIDLTLSDEDDEPVQPNKRARPNEPISRVSNNKSTPNPSSDTTRAPPLSMPLSRQVSHSNMFGNNNFDHRSSSSASPFSPNTAPIPAFGRPTDLHPSLSMSNWPAMHSPSAPFLEGGDPNARLSTSQSPYQRPLRWQPPTVPSNHGFGQSQHASFPLPYNGFAPEALPGRDPYNQDGTMPNGQGKTPGR